MCLAKETRSARRSSKPSGREWSVQVKTARSLNGRPKCKARALIESAINLVPVAALSHRVVSPPGGGSRLLSSAAEETFKLLEDSFELAEDPSEVSEGSLELFEDPFEVPEVTSEVTED